MYYREFNPPYRRGHRLQAAGPALCFSATKFPIWTYHRVRRQYYSPVPNLRSDRKNSRGRKRPRRPKTALAHQQSEPTKAKGSLIADRSIRPDIRQARSARVSSISCWQCALLLTPTAVRSESGILAYTFNECSERKVEKWEYACVRYRVLVRRRPTETGAIFSYSFFRNIENKTLPFLPIMFLHFCQFNR